MDNHDTIQNTSPRKAPRCPVCGEMMEVRTYKNRPQLEYYAICMNCKTEMKFPDTAEWMQITILNEIRYELKRIADALEKSH